jgi:hypothetical protein
MFGHLFPSFDAWWPNIFAWLIQTPVVGTVVWLAHRAGVRRVVAVVRDLHKIHLAEIRKAHQNHVQQVQTMLDDHRRALGLPDTQGVTSGQDAPTLPS